MTIVKTIALTKWTFVDEVMSLLLNVLSRLVITFLLRSKCLLTSWLQSPHMSVGQSYLFRQDTEQKGREMVTPGRSRCGLSGRGFFFAPEFSYREHCRWASARVQERAQALLSHC